jgi:signal transduction histidine kinase
LKKEKAEKESIQKTEDFNTFRYSVSHDLRNPLQSAQHNLSKINALLKDKEEHDVTNIILTIQQSLTGVSQFINRLKDFANADNQAIFRSSFDCQKLIEKIFKEYEAQIDLKKISVKIEDLPHLYTDKVLFSNILSNLISNAIKFSDAEKNTLAIHVFFEKNTNSLCISDNGKGIDEAISPALFQPFVRQYREEEGAGLGLAIVKRLAMQLDIEVSIENNKSDGALAKVVFNKTHLA